MSMLAVALALASSLGLLLAAALLSGIEARARWILALAFAFPLGLGITGLSLLAWRTMGGSVSWNGSLPELAGLTVLAGLSWRIAQSSSRHVRDTSRCLPWSRGGFGYAAGCLGAALIVMIATAVLVRNAPSGQWDAWAMWNMKGRMLARSSDWSKVFDPELPQPDYPLLLPACVARLLALAPGSGTAGPGAIAILFAASTVVVPAATLYAVSGPRTALLGALLAGGGPRLAQQAATQYADVPVGLYFATGIGLMLIARSYDDRGSALLGGVALGLAAWTKNEGIAMVVGGGLVFAVALAWEGGITRLRRLGGPVLAGALILMFPLILLQTAAPPGYMATDGLVAKLVRLLDFDRWKVVASELASWSDPRENQAPWLLVTAVAVAGIRPRLRGGRFVLGTVSVCLAADVLAYLVSPLALEWQLETSLSRVLLQLWPAAVIGAVSVVRSEEPGDQPIPFRASVITNQPGTHYP